MKFLKKCCLNCKFHQKHWYSHTIVIACKKTNKVVNRYKCCKSYQEEN